MHIVESRTCPECGQVYAQRATKLHGLHALTAAFTCPNNHRWTQSQSMTFIGYTYQGKSYDSFGNEITESKIEEIK